MALSLPSTVLSGHSEDTHPLAVRFVGQYSSGLYFCHIVRHGRSSSFTCCRSIAMQYLNRMDHPEPTDSHLHRLTHSHHHTITHSHHHDTQQTEAIVTYLWLVIAWLVIVLVAAYATLLFIGLIS